MIAEIPLFEPIVGEQKQKDFIGLFGAILRMRNFLPLMSLLVVKF